MTHYFFAVVRTPFVTETAIHSSHFTTLKIVDINTDVIYCIYLLYFPVATLEEQSDSSTRRQTEVIQTDGHINRYTYTHKFKNQERETDRDQIK